MSRRRGEHWTTTTPAKRELIQESESKTPVADRRQRAVTLSLDLDLLSSASLINNQHNQRLGQLTGRYLWRYQINTADLHCTAHDLWTNRRDQIVDQTDATSNLTLSHLEKNKPADIRATDPLIQPVPDDRIWGDYRLPDAAEIGLDLVLVLGYIEIG